MKILKTRKSFRKLKLQNFRKLKILRRNGTVVRNMMKKKRKKQN